MLQRVGFHYQRQAPTLGVYFSPSFPELWARRPVSFHKSPIASTLLESVFSRKCLLAKRRRKSRALLISAVSLKPAYSGVGWAALQMLCLWEVHFKTPCFWHCQMDWVSVSARAAGDLSSLGYSDSIPLTLPLPAWHLGSFLFGIFWIMVLGWAKQTQWSIAPLLGPNPWLRGSWTRERYPESTQGSGNRQVCTSDA